MTAKLSYILQSNTAQEAAIRMDEDSASALVVLIRMRRLLELLPTETW